MEEIRRCGAHEVRLPGGDCLQQAVVELMEKEGWSTISSFGMNFR